MNLSNVFENIMNECVSIYVWIDALVHSDIHAYVCELICAYLTKVCV